MGDTASREVEKVSKALLQRSHKGHGRGVLRRADGVREKRRTIEELLFEVHCPTHKKTCPLCMNNMMVGGWRYDGNRDSWYKTRDGSRSRQCHLANSVTAIGAVL